MSELTAGDLVAMIGAMAASMEENRDLLCALDGHIGDADHGVAMALGMGAARDAAAALAAPAPTDVFNTAAKAFLNAVGASSGPLYATAFMRAGAALKDKDSIGPEDARAMIVAMAEGIAHRGKASPGDKTMLDAWAPAAEAARDASGSVADILAAAAEAAQAGAEDTAAYPAKLGRAARLGERSVGHVDPGAASTAFMLRAMAEAAGG